MADGQFLQQQHKRRGASSRATMCGIRLRFQKIVARVKMVLGWTGHERVAQVHSLNYV